MSSKIVKLSGVILAGGSSMPGAMRYPDSGGLPAEGRARREMVRLQAAQMFAQDASPVQVAYRLRVSTKSVSFPFLVCNRTGRRSDPLVRS